MSILGMLIAACVAIPLLIFILWFLEGTFAWRDSAQDIILDENESLLLRLVLLPVWLVLVVFCFLFTFAVMGGILNAVGSLTDRRKQ